MIRIFFSSLRRWRFSTAVLLSGLFVASSHAQSCDVDSAGKTRGRHGLKGHFNRCADIPPGALPMPNGYFVRNFQALQAGKAEIDDFTIYYNEWYMGGMELGPFGVNHLFTIAKRLPECPHPVILQPTGDLQVDTARQQKVISILLNAGLADAPNRVLLAPPMALDLDGMESQRIYLQMLIPSGGRGQMGAGAGYLSGLGNLSGFGAGFGSGFGGFGNFGGFGSGFGGRGLFGY